MTEHTSDTNEMEEDFEYQLLPPDIANEELIKWMFEKNHCLHASKIEISQSVKNSVLIDMPTISPASTAIELEVLMDNSVTNVITNSPNLEGNQQGTENDISKINYCNASKQEQPKSNDNSKLVSAEMPIVTTTTSTSSVASISVVKSTKYEEPTSGEHLDVEETTKDERNRSSLSGVLSDSRRFGGSELNDGASNPHGTY